MVQRLAELDRADEGIIALDGPSSIAPFIEAAKGQRIWSRELVIRTL